MAKAQDSTWNHAQAFWSTPTADQVEAHDPDNWLKRCRSEEEEEEEVGEEVEEEVNADLRGRSTGSVFSSYVPRGMVRQQQRLEKQPEPKKQQPRRNPHHGAKIQKKSPCKGGFTDRDISSPKLKTAVMA